MFVSSRQKVFDMSASRFPLFVRGLRVALLAGVAAVALSACAANRASIGSTEITGSISDQQSLEALAARYKKNPKDKATMIYFAAALRGIGQSDQAVAVLERGVQAAPRDLDIKIAYAKALTSAGRFDQALIVVNDAIDPAAPDWNALSVKGAVLDQNGHNAEARQLYQQALTIAPNQPSLYANIGLSFAMSNDLTRAEEQLRIAAKMRGATSQIRQNLALVVGLQGRFDEARQLYAAELSAAEVEANMSYIRALLTQQNRWDKIKEG